MTTADELYFPDNMAQKAIDVIKRYYGRNERLRVFYGNIITGEVWPEEHDVLGRVSCTTGERKTPMLVHNHRSMGSSALLGASVIGIAYKYSSKAPTEWLYKHPKFRLGTWAVRHTSGELFKNYEHNNKYEVTHNGEVHARFDTEKRALRYAAFMQGERMSF